MKFTSIFVVLLIMIGCIGPAKFTIPDEPKFRQMNAYSYKEDLFFEKKFVNNIWLLKAYADELRRMLVDIQKDGR